MENSIQELEKKENNIENKTYKIVEENNDKNEIIESNVILTESEILEKKRQELLKQNFINLQKQKYERFIEIIMNQTTYTKEEAIDSLEKHKGDITLVIKEFLGVVDNHAQREKEQNSKSLHQKKYSVIRQYMDNAATNFMKQQEYTKKYNEFYEKQKKAHEEQKAQEAQHLKKDKDSE